MVLYTHAPEEKATSTIIITAPIRILTTLFSILNVIIILYHHLSRTTIH